MKVRFVNLKFRQFLDKTSKLVEFKWFSPPKNGWISYFRTSLNMKQIQVAKKLGLSQPAVKHLENSEQAGTITLNSLRKVAEVFNCDLAYAFIPRSNMKEFLEKKAMEISVFEVEKMNQTMALEAQALSKKEIENQVRRYAKELIEKMDKKLWD